MGCGKSSQIKLVITSNMSIPSPEAKSSIDLGKTDKIVTSSQTSSKIKEESISQDKKVNLLDYQFTVKEEEDPEAEIIDEGIRERLAKNRYTISNKLPPIKPRPLMMFDFDKSGFHEFDKSSFHEFDKSGFHEIDKSGFQEFNKSGFHDLDKSELNNYKPNLKIIKDLLDVEKGEGFNNLYVHSFDANDDTILQIMNELSL